MLEQRLIRTSALHRRTGEVILWIQLPLDNVYNTFTDIQLPLNNIYRYNYHSTTSISNPPRMLLWLQLPLRMQLPPNPTQTSCCCSKTCKSHQQQSPAVQFLETLSYRWKLGDQFVKRVSGLKGVTLDTECANGLAFWCICAVWPGVPNPSIWGACNAFRSSSHQLETLPLPSLHQWETPPSSSHHSQLKAPTLMGPPCSYSEDRQFQNLLRSNGW